MYHVFCLSICRAVHFPMIGTTVTNVDVELVNNKVSPTPTWMYT